VGAGAGGGVSDRDGAVDRTFPDEKIADFGPCFHVVSVPPAFIDAAEAALTDPGAHAEGRVFERWGIIRPGAAQGSDGRPSCRRAFLLLQYS